MSEVNHTAHRQKMLHTPALRCATAHDHQIICAVKSHSSALAAMQHSKFNIVYITHSHFNAWNASLVVRLHSWAIACTPKPTSARCKIFLEGTLMVANSKDLASRTNLCSTKIKISLPGQTSVPQNYPIGAVRLQGQFQGRHVISNDVARLCCHTEC